MIRNARVPLVGFAAFSGTGKTTLLSRIIPILRERGLRIAVVKHTHHDFDIDRPGKDSHTSRQAGAIAVLIGSRHRWALIKETPGADEPTLDELVAHLEQDELDLILVEGFKHERFPKVEVHRPSLGKPLLFREDPTVIAIATDETLLERPPIPVLDLNRPEQIAVFILDNLIPSPELADMG